MGPYGCSYPVCGSVLFVPRLCWLGVRGTGSSFVFVGGLNYIEIRRLARCGNRVEDTNPEPLRFHYSYAFTGSYDHAAITL